MKNLLVLALLLLAITNVSAQSEEARERETLRGLTGVYVIVDSLKGDVVRDGLTLGQLQTDVEVRLRKAGIRVLTLEEVRESENKPALVISVVAIKSDPLSKLLESNRYSFSISLELKQAAHLKRMPATTFMVTTWSDRALGFATADNTRVIREGVGDYVDKFINSYLTVNPK
jgi:hypothetical protein